MTADIKQQILDQVRSLPPDEKNELLKELFPEIQTMQQTLAVLTEYVNSLSHDDFL